jgi:pimeloyl-ACP methyl ester carboxylesterase
MQLHKERGMNTNIVSNETFVRSQLRRRKRGFAFWARRVLLALLALLVGLALIGASYQAIASANDGRIYPPPGQLVDVGGYRLHMQCSGMVQPGSPTVILEAGGGMASPSWAWVQSAVAATTRVCAYDRAGYGWSDPGPTPRDARQIAHELHTLLQRAAIIGPYVLVGHSIGGLYMRVYAAQYPNEVAGLVLVDASHPDQLARSPALKAEQEGSQRMLQFAPLLARLGIVRVSGMLEFMASGLPAQQQAEMIAFLANRQQLGTMLAELAAWEIATEQTRNTGSLGARPLVVVTAGTDSSQDWPMLQDDLLTLSSNSVHQIVGPATHISLLNAQADADVTSAAIRQVVAAARSGAALR